jgi:hypothetical protein
MVLQEGCEIELEAQHPLMPELLQLMRLQLIVVIVQ